MPCFKRQVTWLFGAVPYHLQSSKPIHYYRKIRQAKTNMKKDSRALKNPKQQILYLSALKPLPILIAPPPLYFFQQSEGSIKTKHS